jgi:UDP-glucose 4-epimerase
VIQVFEKVSGQNYLTRLSIEEGDVVSAYTNTDKANTILGWKPDQLLKKR